MECIFRCHWHWQIRCCWVRWHLYFHYIHSFKPATKRFFFVVFHFFACLWCGVVLVLVFFFVVVTCHFTIRLNYCYFIYSFQCYLCAGNGNLPHTSSFSIISFLYFITYAYNIEIIVRLYLLFNFNKVFSKLRPLLSKTTTKTQFH